MIDDIYNRKIIEFAAQIDHIGKLDNPDATSSQHSRICGSTVTVDIKVDAGIVTEFAHEVRACALGQASSAIMAKHIVGSTIVELRGLRETMIAMLEKGGEPPKGKFADFACLEPVKNYKARQPSTLLTFNAVVDCFDQIEQKIV